MILANYAQQNRNSVREWGIGFTNPLAQFRPTLLPSFYTPAQPMAAGYDKSAFNPGYNTHYAWQHAYKPGGLSSHNAARAAASFSGSGALGRNIAGAFAAVASFTGAGQLVVSAAGSFSAVASFSGSAVATLSAAASFSAVSSFSGSVTAKAWATGQFLPVLTMGATATATGKLVGVFPPPSGDLTAEQVATAVWAAVAASNNDVGSMGEKLNDAGSAGNPWATALEGSVTAGELVKIISAAVAGKVSVAGSTVTFRDVQDITDRIVATVDSTGQRTAVTVDGS